jgi:hypothetical protein
MKDILLGHKPFIQARLCQLERMEEGQRAKEIRTWNLGQLDMFQEAKKRTVKGGK